MKCYLTLQVKARICDTEFFPRSKRSLRPNMFWNTKQSWIILTRLAVKPYTFLISKYMKSITSIIRNFWNDHNLLWKLKTLSYQNGQKHHMWKAMLIALQIGITNANCWLTIYTSNCRSRVQWPKNCMIENV